MDNIHIKKVTINELDQLVEIGKTTFATAFSAQNSAENMKEYLESGFSKSKIETELTNKNSEFYFAKHESKIIGYLKINFGDAQTEIKDYNALEIERIYVRQNFQRKKVGQKLCNRAIEIAKQNKLNYIWLGVWEENPSSIKFYEKNEFVAFDKHIFKLGDDEQIDIKMKLEMKY